jgi:hypothetical protein
MPVTIVVLFYGDKAILGHSFLPAGLAIFVLAVIVGQAVSCRILIAPAASPAARRAGTVLLAALVAAFSLCTFFPPHGILWEDPHTHLYGILPGQ